MLQPTPMASELELATPDLWNCPGWTGPVGWVSRLVPVPPNCQLCFAGMGSQLVSSVDALRPVVRGFLIPELGSSP